ncbi:MAG TPA: hypothetical protein VFV25_10435, partial [Methylibium sp.]
ETMAATRARLDPSVLSLVADMNYTDVWADTSQAGVTARPSIALRCTGNPNPADDLATPVPTNGIVNYPDHIQPIWSRSRGANTCTNCHTSADTVLNLSATIAGSGRMASYDRLMIGDPLLDPKTGLPQVQIEDGVPVIMRKPALVDTEANESMALGLARKSRLIEIMFGQSLMAGADAIAAHPNPPSSAPNHASMLNAAEKRLVTEWIDLGGKYYNNPFASGSTVRSVNTLNQATFVAQVYPILRTTCAAGCHQAIGSDKTTPAGTSFRENRLVLTGDPVGDFNVTLTMISDTCHPANNYLLSKPSTIPHPAGATGQTTAVLPAGSAGYTAISNWIASGCPTP